MLWQHKPQFSNNVIGWGAFNAHLFDPVRYGVTIRDDKPGVYSLTLTANSPLDKSKFEVQPFTMTSVVSCVMSQWQMATVMPSIFPSQLGDVFDRLFETDKFAKLQATTIPSKKSKIRFTQLCDRTAVGGRKFAVSQYGKKNKCLTNLCSSRLWSQFNVFFSNLRKNITTVLAGETSH